MVGNQHRCPAGHRLEPRRVCLPCRRDQIITQVAAAESSLPVTEVAAAVDTVATNSAVWRSLAHAFAADPDALASGAPATVGRLVTELINRGSTSCAVPACTVCGRTEKSLTRVGAGGLCGSCATRASATKCTGCMEATPRGKCGCDRCRLRRRALEILSSGTGNVRPELSGLLEAISTTRTPRSALDWLGRSAAAAILAEMAAGAVATTHEALDEHPRIKAADYLRHLLTAHGVLEPRDEQLARTQRWLQTLLASIEPPEHRQLVQSFASWQVMRRLRRSAEANPQPRTYTAHAQMQIKTAADFLTWLTTRNRSLDACRQADIDDWLTTGSNACRARDFLRWAGEQGRCPAFQIPGPQHFTGTATQPDQRWALVSRLLHDDALQVTDRVAGCLLLLFGQQQTRIAVMTTDQITSQADGVTIRFGRHDLPVPKPLGELLLQLIQHRKPHIGTGSPTDARWLFPGGLPGRPITAYRLAKRLRALGINTRAARRATLVDLAATLPVAVLADLLNMHPTTAVHWMRQAGGDWNHYAADIARSRNHQP